MLSDEGYTAYAYACSHPLQSVPGCTPYATPAYPPLLQSGHGYADYATSAYSPAGPHGHELQGLGISFLQTQILNPVGMTWACYVQSGACYIDRGRGFLAGPWAECIEAAVQIEHASDVSRLPDYANREGLAGQILTALRQWLGTCEDRETIMEAAERLKDRAHEILALLEDRANLYSSLESKQLSCRPHDVWHQPIDEPMQPHGMQANYGYCQHFEGSPHFCAQPGYAHGPTLLQSRVGMHIGAKVSLGSGATAVGVAGEMLLANHAGEIGDAMGDAAGCAGDGVEEVRDLQN